MHWLQKLTSAVLRQGPIPRHVAFIMDGNRRFAKKNHADTLDGHREGFKKLKETLDWCLELGIKIATVYAFSMENFNRTKKEVDGLMQLAQEKFTEMLEQGELIEKHGACVRVLGNIQMLSAELQKTMARVIRASRHNNRVILNICFAYSAQEEMVQAAAKLAEGVAEGILYPSDVTEDLYERCFYTEDCPSPDIVIRTSGETRLSDFLLWQTSHSQLAFLPTFWPEFSFWQFGQVILQYQLFHKHLQEEKKQDMEIRISRQEQSDLEQIKKKLSPTLHANGINGNGYHYCNGNGHIYSSSSIPELELVHALRTLQSERAERQRQFMQRCTERSRMFIDSLCRDSP